MQPTDLAQGHRDMLTVMAIWPGYASVSWLSDQLGANDEHEPRRQDQGVRDTAEALRQWHLVDFDEIAGRPSYAINDRGRAIAWQLGLTVAG